MGVKPQLRPSTFNQCTTPRQAALPSKSPMLPILSVKAMLGRAAELFYLCRDMQRQLKGLAARHSHLCTGWDGILKPPHGRASLKLLKRPSRKTAIPKVAQLHAHYKSSLLTCV